MFTSCSSLKELDLSNFNTNNVRAMCHMFTGCSSLKELNISNFNTKKVIDMSYMLFLCLDELKLIFEDNVKIPLKMLLASGN